MSLNFPTAFWKTDVDTSDLGRSITWESALWWSHGPGEYDSENSIFENFDLQQNTNFPFIVENDEYYSDYTVIETYAQLLQVASTCYFGWYLDGGPDNANPAPGKNDLSDYHEAEPWAIGTSGHQLNLKYESDYKTAWDSGVETVITYLETTYNLPEPFVENIEIC